MKYIKQALLLTCLAILIASCSKTSKQGKMIPGNAAIIVDINLKSLSSKLGWDEIKQTWWFKKVSADSTIPAWVKSLIDDPSKSGMDTRSDVVFFVLKKNDGMQIVVEGDIKDVNTFAGFNKNLDPASVATKEGDLNLMKIKDRGAAGWNNEKFAYVFSAPDKNLFTHSKDSVSMTTPLPSQDNLMSACKNIFSLNPDSSFYKNEKFANLLSEDGDIHYWLNSAALYNGSMPGALGMINLDKFMQGSISTASVNFENGKITTTHRSYASKELTEILKKYNGNINTDMIDHLPASNLAVVLALQLPPQELVDMIKLTGLDGMANLALAQQGLSLDDFAKATNGDMVFALSDLSMKSDTSNHKNDSMHNEKPDLKFLFSAAVADKDAFNKILNSAKKMSKDKDQSASPNYKMNDKYFALSNSPDAVNNFLSGTKANHAFLDKIKDHTTGGFIDMQMIIKVFGNMASKDSLHKALYDLNIKMWDNIFITGDGYKDGGIVHHAEINLVDKNTNSLKQLNAFLDAVSQIAMSEKKKMKEEASTRKDSTIINPGYMPKNNLHNKTRKK